MRSCFLFLFFIAFIQQGCAQTTVLNNYEEIKAYSDKVMQKFGKLNYSETFDLLKQTWPMPESELDEIQKLAKEQLDGVSSRYGKVIGPEFVKEVRVKDFAVREIYVLRFEKHLIRVIITYYRGDKGWMLNNFKYDDKMDLLFEE